MRGSWLALAGLGGMAGMAAGCGSSPNCTTTTALSVEPATGTAVAADAAPGNQVQFQAVSRAVLVHPGEAGCGLPALEELVQANWVSSDPVRVSVSSAAGATNGLATCHSATSTPVTLTATAGTGTTAQTATAQITCQ